MQRRTVTIQNRVTRVPLRVDPVFESSILGNASAFFYALNKRTFLITNWHVVSGRNPAGRAPLLSNAAIPDSLKLHIPIDTSREGVKSMGWKEGLLPLYVDESRTSPVWFVHPVHREAVDVVAIPLDGLSDTMLLAANDKGLDLDDLDLYPSLDVYVVGFPRAMFGGARLPIWKRGSIATEPDFDIDGLPKFLIDTATREGMSGAPVYAQEVGTWMPRGVTDPGARIIGKGRMFVGVYSGRIGAENEFKAQLGIVWKASVINEIISAAQRGDSSFGAPGA